MWCCVPLCRGSGLQSAQKRRGWGLRNPFSHFGLESCSFWPWTRRAPESCPQEITKDLPNGDFSSVTSQNWQECPKSKRVQRWLMVALGAKRRNSSMVRPGQAGSIERMVAHLVPAFLGLDPSYLHTFLASYRALASTQQVLDLLFTRYGCVLPHSEEDGGPLHQLTVAMSSILDTWLSQYPEDFYQPPNFPCLKMVLAYVQMSMTSSALEHRALLLLAQLEQLEASQKEAEGADPEEDEVPLLAQHLESKTEGSVASPPHLQQPPPSALPEGQEQEQEAPLTPDWEPQQAADSVLTASLTLGQEPTMLSLEDTVLHT